MFSRGGRESCRTMEGQPGLPTYLFLCPARQRRVDIVTVKDLLGPSKISTTLRYGHSNDNAKRWPAERLSTGGKTMTSWSQKGQKDKYAIVT
jgi:hypothetical protein